MICFSTRVVSTCRNRQKRRSGFSYYSGFKRINKKIHELESLPPASFSNRQDPFDKTTASLTLSPETALSPEYPFSQNPLSSIVGRFDTFNLDKCPQSFPMPEDIFAHTFCLFVSALLATSEKSLHSGFEGDTLLYESLSGHFSIFEALPQIEHPYFFSQTPLSNGFRCTSEGYHFLEIPYQMRMADSTAFYWKTPVSFPPITPYNTTKITPKKMESSIRTTFVVDMKNGQIRCHRRPEPGPPVAFLPPRFIYIDDSSLGGSLLYLLYRCFYRSTDGLLNCAHTSKRELDSQDILKKPLGFTATEAVAPGEKSDSSLQARPERTPGHIFWKLGACHFPACGAFHCVQQMLHDCSSQERHIYYLMTEGIHQKSKWVIFQRSATVLTRFGVMMLCSGIFILRHRLSMVTWMAFLSSLWTTRWRLLLFGLYPGWIRGGGLRRIGRVLSQSTLKNPNLIFESPILNFKFRQTLDKGDEKILNGWMKRCQ